MSEEKENRISEDQTNLATSRITFEKFRIEACKQLKIQTYLRGLKNPPKTAEEMDQMVSLIGGILEAFLECERRGMSFRNLSEGINDLRFEMKALNNSINRSLLDVKD